MGLNVEDVQLNILKRLWLLGHFEYFTTTKNGTNWKQVAALKALRSDILLEIMFGGGAGGGKSWIGCLWIAMECLEKAGSEFLVLRETYTKIKETTFSTFLEILQFYKIPTHEYRVVGATVIFSNGSIARFRGGDYRPRDPEFGRFGSYNLTGIFIDEAQEVRSKLVSMCLTRLRRLQGKDWIARPKLFYSCNPYRNWIYHDFYDAQRNGLIRQNRTFIASLATDNPNLPKSYIDTLEQADEITRQRMLYGNFDYDDSEESLVTQSDILLLKQSKAQIDYTRRRITADIALGGSDRFVIMVWYGWVLIEVFIMAKSTGSEVVDKIRYYQQKHSIPNEAVAFDADGVGGYIGGYIHGAVNFQNGGKALNGENYPNLKTQCIYKTVAALKRGQIRIHTTVSQEIQIELFSELFCWRRDAIDSDGKLRIKGKAAMKQLNKGKSPDLADPFMMLQVFEFQEEHVFETMSI